MGILKLEDLSALIEEVGQRNEGDLLNRLNRRKMELQKEPNKRPEEVPQGIVGEHIRGRGRGPYIILNRADQAFIERDRYN